MPKLSRTAADDMADVSELLARAVARRPPVFATGRPLLREEVYARVRDWIVEGLLPPETRLRDVDIAEALDVSRTPVREAIRRLEDEGLVVAEASRWTKVASVETETADRVYPIVWTLERLAVSLSGGHWDADRLAELRAANDRLAAAIADQDALKASDADTDFHRQLVAGAGNPELAAIIESLKVRLRRVEITYFGGTVTAEPSVSEHARAIAALEAGDLDLAAAEIEDNWRSSLARLHERRASHVSRPVAD
jgi:DNA-binding GntR family transcriptional regulator